MTELDKWSNEDAVAESKLERKYLAAAGTPAGATSTATTPVTSPQPQPAGR